MRCVRAHAAHLLLCAVVVACRGGSEGDSSTVAEAPKDAIANTVEHGPVKVTTKVWPAKPTLSDPIYLRLEIASTPGVRINAPFQEAGDHRLGRFRIVGFTRDGAGTPSEVQTYTLEAPASGKQRIPPMRIEMIDGRPDRSANGSGGNGSTAGAGDSGHGGSASGTGGGSPAAASASAGSSVVASGSATGGSATGGSASASGSGTASASPIQEVLTEEVALEIAPVSAEQLSAKMHGAAETLDPDVGGPPWMTILLIVSAVAVIGSGTVLALRARAARRKIAARRSAYEEAVARLAQLEQRGAPEPAFADAWFVDLSDIVRNYLEHRYEIRAPELTTEEFLLVASQSTAITTEHRALLSAFLVRCDRVKFAGYRPDSEESLASLKAARAFVEDTRASQVVSA